MGKNKTQPKIKAFLEDLSKICNEHDMIVDANGGGGKPGEGKLRDESRFREGCPLVLYTRSGTSNNFRKIGYLWYSFVGEEEGLAYNFDPKPGTPYKEVIATEAGDYQEEEKRPKLKIKRSKSKSNKPSGLKAALKKAKKWESELDK